ncbi:ABC transporter permease [Roseateles koreensis]|uniref:ABC transporter permease subunit n=1 Tax=Roseateles koreensis TaxID=2987526 RepID=A0ABT5KVA1_9BURK|nr:ABC transporter permease subunit [Roseateles koreensis]MDC8786868.1 ABC transporter permease subunit [Roseateles koreensis]
MSASATTPATSPATSPQAPLHPLWKIAGLGRRLVIGVPLAWLLVCFAVPFLIVLKISVSDMDAVRVMDLSSYVDGVLRIDLHLSGYGALFEDAHYIRAYLLSLRYAALTTAGCLFIAYPFAYFMARSKPHVQPVLVMLVMLPFWTSFLLRIYAWKGLLSEHGWVAQAIAMLGLDRLLAALGLIAVPGQLMNTPFSLLVGMVYCYVPFMVLPLYAHLAKMDLRLLEAAADLGARPWTAFWRITVPLSKTGIIAGCLLVFIPCVGEFVIPELLGGPKTQMIGRVLWDEFFGNNDWPLACGVAVLLILLVMLPLNWFNRIQAQEARA